MKKLIAILAASAIGLSSAIAADSTAKSSNGSSMAKSSKSTAGNMNQPKSGRYVQIGDLSAQAVLGAESEYVFRGKKMSGFSFLPSTRLGYPVGPGELYGALWTVFPVDAGPVSNGLTSNRDEVDFHFGYNMVVPNFEMLSLDLGYTYYWYPQGNVYDIDRSNEIYFGVTADLGSLGGTYNKYYPTMSGYIFYNWDLEQWVLQVDATYSLELAQFNNNLGGMSVDFAGWFGVLSADVYQSDRHPTTTPKWENGYAYLGLKADLVFAFNDVCSASVGLRWSANNDGTGAFPTSNTVTAGPISANEGNHEEMFWWGTAVKFAF
jgi:hypothetical protein